MIVLRMKKLIYLSKIENDTLYLSEEHKVIMFRYYERLDAAIDSLAPTKEAYLLLDDICKVVVDYSNSFGEERDEFFYEWIRVIPTNLTYAVGGFIAGLRNSNNSELCNIYYSEVFKAASDCLMALNIVKPDDE